MLAFSLNSYGGAMLHQRAEGQQHRGDAEVGRVHEVPHPAVHRRPQHVLAADADHDAEDHRPELVVAVEQHVDGERGDVRGQQELVQPAQAVAPVARLALIRPGADHLEAQLGGVADEDREDRPEPGLLEAEHGVAEDVEHADRDREVAQREIARIRLGLGRRGRRGRRCWTRSAGRRRWLIRGLVAVIGWTPPVRCR